MKILFIACVFVCATRVLIVGEDLKIKESSKWWSEKTLVQGDCTVVSFVTNGKLTLFVLDDPKPGMMVISAVFRMDAESKSVEALENSCFRPSSKGFVCLVDSGESSWCFLLRTERAQTFLIQVEKSGKVSFMDAKATESAVKRMQDIGFLSK